MSHTTVSIDNKTYKKSSKRAKSQQLSVSAIARMLLNAYAEGQINIVAVQSDNLIELRELSKNEMTSKMRKAANVAYKKNKKELINIPV